MRKTQRLALISLLAFSAGSASAADVRQTIQAAIHLPCQAKTIPTLRPLAERVPSAQFKSNWVQYSLNWVQHSRSRITGRLVFAAGDDELVVRFTGSIGSPDYVTARYDAGTQRRPQLLAIADANCTIHTARRLRYDQAGRPEWLEDLDGALHPIGEPESLNPPIPLGRDSPGIPIGLVDSGANYLLPEIGPG